MDYWLIPGIFCECQCGCQTYWPLWAVRTFSIYTLNSATAVHHNLNLDHHSKTACTQNKNKKISLEETKQCLFPGVWDAKNLPASQRYVNTDWEQWETKTGTIVKPPKILSFFFVPVVTLQSVYWEYLLGVFGKGRQNADFLPRRLCGHNGFHKHYFMLLQELAASLGLQFQSKTVHYSQLGKHHVWVYFCQSYIIVWLYSGNRRLLWKVCSHGAVVSVRSCGIRGCKFRESGDTVVTLDYFWCLCGCRCAVWEKQGIITRSQCVFVRGWC